MNVRKMLSVLSLLLVFSFSAKAETNLLTWWQETFPAAEKHPGLTHAYEPLKLEKIKKYVVLLKDGIPAEQPPYFISWQDYDYRAVVVKNDKIKTHRGSAYTKLKKGDVLAVVEPDHFSKRYYVKLITPQAYRPAGSDEKNVARVTVMLGFEFPKNAEQAFAEKSLNEWLQVFPSLADAQKFALTLQNDTLTANSSTAQKTPATAKAKAQKNAPAQNEQAQKELEELKKRIQVLEQQIQAPSK